MPRAAPLVKAYLAALQQGRALCVQPALKGDVSYFGGPLGAVAQFWFQKPVHAELVASRCHLEFHEIGAMRPDGWINLPPSDVAEKINMVARELGARWQTEKEIRCDAEKVVAGIIAKVDAARRDGSLREVNISYKIYRQKQLAKGEPAMPFSAHVAHFVRNLVIRAAQESLH